MTKVFDNFWQIWIKLDKNSTKIHQIWPHLPRKRGKAHPSRQNVTKSHQHLTNWNQIGQEFNKNSPNLFKSHPNVSKIHQIQWKFNKMEHIWMKFDKIKALKAEPLRQRLPTRWRNPVRGEVIWLNIDCIVWLILGKRFYWSLRYCLLFIDSWFNLTPPPFSPPHCQSPANKQATKNEKSWFEAL